MAASGGTTIAGTDTANISGGVGGRTSDSPIGTAGAIPAAAGNSVVSIPSAAGTANAHAGSGGTDRTLGTAGAAGMLGMAGVAGMAGSGGSIGTQGAAGSAGVAGAGGFPLICPSNKQNCDGDDANGCELDRRAGPSCDANIPVLGTIAGDVGSDALEVVGTGHGWYRVTVREDDTSPFPINTYQSATLSLDNPDGVDFDLYLYCASCNTAIVSSSESSGSREVIEYRKPDTASDDTRELLIEIRYYGGTACGSWKLTVAGNRANSGVSCP